MTAGEQLERRVTYRHALGEATGLPVSSVDLVTLQFVIHEVTVLRNVLRTCTYVANAESTCFGSHGTSYVTRRGTQLTLNAVAARSALSALLRR